MDEWSPAWNAGTLTDAYRYFGCHTDKDQTVFRVWAPGAFKVYVTGSFCDWEPNRNEATETSKGIFTCILSNIREYDTYKFVIIPEDAPSIERAAPIYKSDPFAFHTETPPANASKVYASDKYNWSDARFLSKRKNEAGRPLNIYELHAGSFRIYQNGTPLNYRKLSGELCVYLKEMGYTHLCLLPILEHIDLRFGGMETTGFFAPTSRYGTLKDFLSFVDNCHQADLGVIMDWNPLGFPTDDFGLSDFCGRPLYEAEDAPTDGFRPFDFERPEVISFLTSCAFFLLDHCHLDGLKIQNAPQIACRPGGTAFLKNLCEKIREAFPGCLAIGDGENTPFDRVTDRQTALAIQDRIIRGSEAEERCKSCSSPKKETVFLLNQPFLSGENLSLIGRMTGNYEEKFSRLRAVFALFYALPGKKLVFMGDEFAQFAPFVPHQELHWMLLDYEMHRKFQTFVKQLNDFYRKTPALWELDGSGELEIAFDGFPLVSGLSRRDREGNELITLVNFSSEWMRDLELGVDHRGKYTELFSTDEIKYGGEGRLNGTAFAKLRPAQGKPFCMPVTLPPLTAVYLFKTASRPKGQKTASP